MHMTEPHLSLSLLETSQVTSPTSETPEPVAMVTEAKTPAAEPGEMRSWSDVVYLSKVNECSVMGNKGLVITS